MMADRRKSDRHLSSFHLELRRLGQASVDEQAWIDHHLQACHRCAEMAAAFESDRREFAAPPRGAAAPRPAVASAPHRPVRRRLWTFGLGLALPAAAAIALFVGVRRAPGPAAEPEIAAKGGAGLMLFARRGTRVFPVDAATRLRAGDQVRFVVTDVRQPYLLIAAIDGSGRSSVYFPYEGAQSAAVGARPRFEVPGSIVVDASAGPERFFALFSSHPLQTSSVRDALGAVLKQGKGGIRNGSRLDVGADEQTSILVEKEGP
jgi:hypothetical protein